MEKYFKYCRIKGKRRLPNIDEIFPILKECYGVKWAPTVERLCESVFPAYYEYTYDNKADNKIGKCGKENADKMHDFCVRHYDTLRGWDENGAYMFYMLFQNIFRFMVNAIDDKLNGLVCKLKMICQFNYLLLVIESVVVDRGGKLVALVFTDEQAIAKALLDVEARSNIPENIRIGANRQLPAYSQIYKVELQAQPFEKTPKMSIKRFLYK